MSQPLHNPTSKATDESSRLETKNTTCYMCACRCGIRVTLRDGEVRYIQGNPEHPLNKGVICAKGASGIMKQYSPARLTKPLMRKPGSDRGDNDFIETKRSPSWKNVWRIFAPLIRRNLPCSLVATRCRR
jgi:anaerobic selenocysteine-containing dehydrogenase